MLIVVDKPQWLSSFDIIRALKRELGEKKIWHSGTLDPMATGLLLIWTDKDTKKLHELTGLDKKYYHNRLLKRIRHMGLGLSRIFWKI